MSRGHSENRKKAKKIWLRSGRQKKPKQIADELGLSAALVRKWKCLDRWDDIPAGPQPVGAPKGNKNAVGNKGGPGGPPRNKKALKTGEYETIWLDSLEAEEKILLFEVETDPVEQIINEIRLLEIRERRMLQMRAKVLEGWDADSVSTKSEAFKAGIGEKPVFDETGELSWEKFYLYKMQETERTVKSHPKLERILSIEEGLTRVQDKKARFIELLNKIEARALNEEEQRVRIQKLQAEVKALGAKEW